VRPAGARERGNDCDFKEENGGPVSAPCKRPVFRTYRISLQTLEVDWEGRITLEDMPEAPGLRPLNSQPPPKQIAGLFFSPDGDLWVFPWGPDERWGPGRAFDGASLHELFDTTIFVLDRQLQLRAV
jgi:hypothetical protein